MTPPHTDPMSVTHTNPNSLPTLPSLVDPDANEEGDYENIPPDVPELSTAPIEDRADPYGFAEGDSAAENRRCYTSRNPSLSRILFPPITGKLTGVG